jgi:parvulin-like peptidyl-prolyl isomerase
MGTLSNIRKVSPYALGLFAIIFIGFMVLSDADVSNLIRQGQTLQSAIIGKVNGEKILYKDFEEKVRTQVEQERAQSKDPEAEIDETRIRQQVWNQLVDNVLINQEAQKLGITVTTEEIRDEMINNPPDYLKRSFTDSTGKFMKEIYLELVTNPSSYVKYLGADPTKISQEEKDAAVNRLRNDLIEIEDYIKRTKIFGTLQRTIGFSNSVISNAFATVKYRAENSVADVKVIAFRPGSVKPESIKISDQEIKSYYDEHKKYYKQEAQARLKYLNFQIKPSQDDSARALRNINEIGMALASVTDPLSKDSIFDIKLSEYGGTTSEFTPVNQVDQTAFALFKDLTNGSIVGPVRNAAGVTYYRLDERRTGETPTVKASHILIRFDNNKDSALAVANAIFAKAKSGSDFAELARTNSTDQGSAVNGGDVGFFGKGQMVQPFEEAAFAAGVGQVVGPVESQFGYHIIKVTDKINEEIKYSSITITPSISNATKNQIFREAYSISKQVEAGESFDVVAKRLKKEITETPFFTNERPIFNSWYLTNQAFDLEIGTVIEPLELKFYGVIIAQVSGKKQAGVVSLEDKKEEIKTILLKKKQLDILKSKAEKVFAQVKSIGDLDLAKAQDPSLEVFSAPGMKGNGTITGMPKDVVLNTNIFSTKNNGIFGPVRGENAYYIVQVSGRIIPAEMEIKSKLAEYSKSLSTAAAQNAFNGWYTKVKKDAEIVDERAKYYKEF